VEIYSLFPQHLISLNLTRDSSALKCKRLWTKSLEKETATGPCEHKDKRSLFNQCADIFRENSCVG